MSTTYKQMMGIVADIVAEMERAQAILLPGRDGQRPPTDIEIANEGEEPQVENADGTKHPAGDQTSEELEAAYPTPEQSSEHLTINTEPYHPNEPVVESMEVPATAKVPDSVAANYLSEHLDEQLQSGVDPVQSADNSSQPSLLHDDPPAPDSSSLVDPDVPACKRLISRTFLPHEVVSLIEAIFTSKDEVKMIRDLGGDDAQTFIDVVHEGLDLPNFPLRLRGKCLNVLCRICGLHALLPRSLHIPLCYDRSDTPLYRGGFADVWKGEHQGRHVAVKVLRVYSTSDFVKITSRFCKEVVTWKALRHQNVLPLLGFTMRDDLFAMVSEWMVNGNINEFIQVQKDANRFELLEDIARGLIYIHGEGMIHGDLKGANILIDQNGHARLADFGLLTIVSDPATSTASSSAATRGTIRWMSPELLHPEIFDLKGSRPTKESDCYALGMVVYEVLSGQAPFAPSNYIAVMRKVMDGERPERPERTEGVWFTDDLWEMLKLSWAPEPKSRPSIETVLERLEQVSRTWKPPSEQMDEATDADGDGWDIIAEVMLPN